MSPLPLTTPDFTAENVAKIAALFPNCVTEVRANDTRNLSSSFKIHNSSLKWAIDFDLLRQELSSDLVEGPQERYRLDWPGKREALALANTPIRKTLRPCREESVDFETTQQLYIEGDNLDALKLLQETYLGKVKMIYIDPPYNTGNDFIYDDNFSMSREEYEAASGGRDEEGNAMFDEEKWRQNSSSHGRFHSEWLSMMYPRLKLARNLLREDGVIFISIDDGEVANLRRICDEVFGEMNFVANAVWQKAYVANMTARHISNTHEHILIYCRDYLRLSLGRFPRTEEQIAKFQNPDNDSRGPWKAENLSAGKFYKAGQFAITTPAGRVVTPPPGRYWRCNEETYKRWLADNRITFGTDGGGRPMLKKFLLEVEEGLTPETWWNHQNCGTNKSASTELKKLFDGGAFFDTPKSVEVLLRMVRLSNSRNHDIILDFFSGSATTAHAVMQLNAEDGGSRRHIMVQLPEPCDEKSEAFKAGYATIAEIGKERIRRAGASIRAELETKIAATQEGSEDHQTLSARLARLDTGFRVLRIDSSNLAQVHHEPDQLAQGDLLLHVDNLKPDRSPEDLLFQVLLDWGVDLGLPIGREEWGIDNGEWRMDNGEKGGARGSFTVFFVDDNALAACFDTGLDEAFIKALAKRAPLRAVFRDGGYANDAVKINIEQIFTALSPHTEIKTI